jgi:hypothetical protein
MIEGLDLSSWLFSKAALSAANKVDGQIANNLTLRLAPT